MNHLSNQLAIRRKHESSKFRKDSSFAKPCRYHDFFKCLSDTLADYLDIIRRLLRTIRNTHTTGQVNKCHLDTGLFLYLNRQLEQSSRKHRIIVIRYRITNKERMNTDTLCTKLRQTHHRLHELRLRHAVL